MQPTRRVTRSQVRRAREEEERTAAGPTATAREEPAPKRQKRSAAVAKKTVQSKAVKKEAETSKQEIVKLELEEREADNTCSICFMSYSNSGEHRVVALKTCGHIFGKGCVEHWVRQGERAGNPHCPLCKVTTAIREVLPLFVKSINSVSNDELDDLRAANQSLGEENSQLNATNEDTEGRYLRMRLRATTAERAIDQVRAELTRRVQEVSALQNELQRKEARVEELQALVKAQTDELAVVRKNLEAALKRSHDPVDNSAGGKETLGGNGRGGRALRKRPRHP